MLREADRGVLLNLTGDGKGKSSSAFGIAVRALGWNWNLAILQFLKGNRPTGERNFFTKYFPEMIFEDLGLGITTCPGDHAGAARRGWERAKELLSGFDGELLILDELNVALHNGYLSVAEVVPALAGRREKLNVVITGRGAPQELLAVSDLVSEVRAIRHPFRTGVPAKKGIDY